MTDEFLDTFQDQVKSLNLQTCQADPLAAILHNIANINRAMEEEEEGAEGAARISLVVYPSFVTKIGTEVERRGLNAFEKRHRNPVKKALLNLGYVAQVGTSFYDDLMAFEVEAEAAGGWGKKGKKKKKT